MWLSQNAPLRFTPCKSLFVLSQLGDPFFILSKHTCTHIWRVLQGAVIVVCLSVDALDDSALHQSFSYFY